MTIHGLYVRSGQFQIRVLAPSVLDAVRFAGGWIFDQVAMGWSVSVAIPNQLDDRPLRVLGAAVLALDSAVKSLAFDPQPSAVVFAANLYQECDEVRRALRHLLNRGECQLVLWGDGLVRELNGQTRPVEHRLSRAACAFKAQSLRAASAESAVRTVETFNSTVDRLRPVQIS